ncbi:MAG TPA: CDP-archaeol synthase [Candidatus Acidoferrales bacterium]|nr:CDP-archaeol synthase [Candidatus Acidoferrales bacterium]
MSAGVGAAARPEPKGSGLLTRVLTGVVLLAILVGLALSGRWGVWVLVVLAGGVGLWEFRSLSARMGYRAPSWMLFPLGFYFAFGSTLLKGVSAESVLALALIGGLTVFLFLPGRREGLGRWAMGLAGAVYVGLPFSYYLLLYSAPAPRGVEWVLSTILTVVISDTAALLVGRRLGRHPFFSRISPHKTAEGALAGLTAAVLTMLLLGALALDLKLIQSLTLGLLIGLSAILGDLVESQMKRMAKVKDASHLIPGHGGVLDRIDSLLLAPILVYFFASLAGVLR